MAEVVGHQPHRGSPTSIPEQITWGLRWTECHWDRFFWEYFGFISRNHSTSDPDPFWHLRCVMSAIYSIVKITYVFIMKAQCAFCEWYKFYRWSSCKRNACFCSREQADVYSFSFSVLSLQFLNFIGHNWKWPLGFFIFIFYCCCCSYYNYYYY